MPIYAYKCGACGHAKDVLQKISAPPLTQCPACGAQALTKQVTAAGFQLKGSGWYATDFRSSVNASNTSDSNNTSDSSSAANANANASTCACAAADGAAATAASCPSSSTPH